MDSEAERERDISTGTRSTGVGQVGGGGWERGVGSRFAIIRVVYLIYYHVYIGLVRSLSGGISANVCV